MLYYFIRLDDATPTMNKDAWNQVELMLDRNNIQPIVGIIPDNRDTLFKWDEDLNFWDITVRRWIEKKWIIAQHGYHHVYHDCGNGKRSEFVGLNFNEQKSIIQSGYQILLSHNCKPSCFYAPSHSFNDITVDACNSLGYFDFISDGYALYPFIDREMTFLPQLYDTPHKVLPFGVYTFILHPNFSTTESINKCEQFIKNNRKHFVSSKKLMEIIHTDRERSFVDKTIEHAMKGIRKIRR